MKIYYTLSSTESHMDTMDTIEIPKTGTPTSKERFLILDKAKLLDRLVTFIFQQIAAKDQSVFYDDISIDITRIDFE